MYEFIILSQLMHGPAHGYLIAMIINDMIGPYARISYGRLYPLLAKLEQNGLITAERAAPSGQQGDRQLRIYTITDAGRVRFKVLMSGTGANPGEYQKLFAYKVAAFGLITPAERLRLIDHYINYSQAHVFHLQTEAEDLVHQAPELAHAIPRVDSDSVEYIANVMQHSIEQWQLELDWARSLREREVALAAKAGTQTPGAAVAERVEK